MSLFENPKGWELKKIEDVIELLYGRNLPKDKRNSSGDIPVYGSNGIVGKHNESLVDFPSLIIGRKGTIGAINRAHGKFWPTDVTYYTRIKNENLIDFDFLHYLLLFLNIPKYRQSGPKSGLNRNDVYKIEFFLPNKEIQQKIIKKLDYILGQLEEKKKAILERKETMMDLISKHPKSFKNRVRNNQGLLLQVENFLLDQAYSGRLTSDFRNKRIEKSDVLDFYDKIRDMKRKLDKPQGKDSIPYTKTNMPDDKFPIPSEWAWGNINEIEIFVGSGSTPKGGKSVYVQNGVPFIRSQNVYSDKLHLDDIAFIPKEIHEQMSRSQLKPGDVLLNITGASIGRSTVVPTSLKEGNVNQHVCIIRTPNLINPEYLSRWLNSSFIQKMILEKQKGETREGLNYTHIRSLPIPITTLEEQNEITRIIKEKNNHVQFIVKRLSDVFLLQEKLLRHIDQTSNSILNMAFSGKLLN